MSYEHLLYEQRGPVTLITINRPERMNAIGPQTHRELVAAWERFRTDDSALVGVLTDAGDQAFCAGGDLKAAMAGERAARQHFYRRSVRYRVAVERVGQCGAA